jgi:tetratricopeptide (TPR) repeat protein
MKFTARVTNLGVELSLHDGDGAKPLKPAPDANQENPRRSYVYAHMDSAGKIFYVGKGEGRRAWSTDRHPLWRRYVEKHLGGNYQVRILQDNLSAAEAEEVEAAWIAQCSDDLVNWVNMGRATDLQALEHYHKLRDANRALIQQAEAIEKRDLVEAVEMYVQAIEAIPAYAFINYEKGLVGQLLGEEADELGRSGEIRALDRLTMCLIKLKRPPEASEHAKSYFAMYRRDLQLAASERIAKRIEKAFVSSR